MTFLTPLSKTLKQRFPTSKIYLVGGTARDKLLNIPYFDIDLVITKIPTPGLENILGNLGSVKLVGKNFGVYKWRPETYKGKREIDIALPRTEKSFGSGIRRDFHIQNNPDLSIEQDLKRRDFTINAIAYDIQSKKYIDPFGGRSDLKKKIIKAVGDPEKRLTEDYSRMLRAIRFACQLNSDIDPKTWNAIKRNMPQIKKITAEIVAAELIKAFCHQPVMAFDLLDESGFWKSLVPELLKMKTCSQPKEWHSEGNVWKHTRLALQKLEESNPKTTVSSAYETPYNPNLTIALLLHDIGKTVTRKKTGKKITFYDHDKEGTKMAGKIISRLRLESAGIKKSWVKWLIRKHMIILSNDPKGLKSSTVIKYFLSNRYPSDLLLQLIQLDANATIPQKKENDTQTRIKTIHDRLKKIKKRLQAPLLNGDEIMKMLGLKSGPELGEIIKKLKIAQIEGKIKTKKDAEKFVRNIKS